MDSAEKQEILNEFIQKTTAGHSEEFKLTERQMQLFQESRGEEKGEVVEDEMLKYRNFLGKYKIGEQEFTALKFLIARQWNIELAAAMYHKQLHFRKTILQEALVLNYSEKDLVLDIYPHSYHKTCRLGRPIQINKFGKFNVKKLFTITTKERFLLDHIKDIYMLTYSILPASSRGSVFSAKEANYVIPAHRQLFNIIDLKGVGLNDFMAVKSVLEELITIDGENFPETLGCMVIINAPWIFASIWALVKQFLDAKTIAKIHILGMNYKSELLKLVDADNLPVSYGGSCRCSHLQGGCEAWKWEENGVPSLHCRRQKR